jgi:sugar lactone lactonase YvrE
METRILKTTFSKIVLGLCLWCAGAPAQIITTVAGTDFVFPSTPLPAVNAPLGNIQGVAVDAQGNVYAADSGNNLVVRISPNGALTVVAGNGIGGFSGDGGPATSASLDGPYGVAVDAAGNLYIADSWNGRIRKVSGGTITTIAGNGTDGFSGDGGPASSASFSDPAGIAVDSAGNLYVADTYNHRIRKVSGGTITTVAGNGIESFSGDGGPATSASLDRPFGVAVDSAGNLYMADTFNSRIRKVSGGTITTVAGGGNGALGDGGPATSASLAWPQGVAVDSSGNLYIADTNYDFIRKVSGGTITTVAGNNIWGYSGDGGPATSASLNFPYGVAVDSAGNVYIADWQNNRIRKVSGGTITTVAGNGFYRYSGDSGPATSASLNQPTGVAVDSFGNLYIADWFNNRIRKVSGGTITTVAGNGRCCFSGDGGSPTSASLNQPQGTAADSAGNLYIADYGNSRVRKVSGGTITTVAGGGKGPLGDGGPATSATLGSPVGVAVDSAGNLYIADSWSNRIRKVSAGTITTVAGNGIGGFSGDGGPATSASLDGPYGAAVDAAGNVYIADWQNNRIRKVSGGTITTVAGNGNQGFSGDGGPATSASLNQPQGVAVDSVGNLYIADSGNERIRKVSGGTITTVAGSGSYGFSGDGGPATSASLAERSNSHWGVAVDSAGNLYIADTYNNRIREVLAAKPAVLVSPANLTFSGQSTGAPAPTQSFSIASVPGLGFSLTVATTDGGNWLSVTPQSGAAPRLINVVADPSTLTSPGAYQGTITIATPDANPAATTINVTFQVSPAQPAALAPLDPRSFSFAFAKSTPAQSQRLTISNAGGGALSFTTAATITTPAGAHWLTLSQASGQATPSSPAILTVTADPTGLGAGTFTGAVSVTAGSTTLSVPVTITISALDQAILLSQRGLFFTAVAQGGVIPPQTFAVLNIGTGVVAWTAKAIPIPAMPVWFSVSPANGSTNAAQSPPAVTVNVDPSKLAVAGTYYGLVEVDAPTAANSPQVLTVVLQLLPAGADTGASLTPGSLLFTTVAGASSPGSQNVQVYNITAKAKSFRSVVSADPGLSIVTLPTDATLDPQNPTPMVVQPLTTALGPGVYGGVVTLEFDDGRVIPLTHLRQFAAEDLCNSLILLARAVSDAKM